jgi:hypothetical protein
MKFERESNQIDQDGNFIFENKRLDDDSDPWLESLETGDIGFRSSYVGIGKSRALQRN